MLKFEPMNEQERSALTPDVPRNTAQGFDEEMIALLHQFSARKFIKKRELM